MHGDPGRRKPDERNDAEPDEPPGKAFPVPLVRPHHDMVEVFSEAGDQHHGDMDQNELEEEQHTQEVKTSGALAVEEDGEARKWLPTAGAIASPVRICNGAAMNTAAK